MKLHIRITALVIAAITAIACSEKKPDPLAEDTSLTRDLALANQDTASKPELRDVPVTTEPAPVVTEPEPAPTPVRTTRPVARKPAPATVTKKPAPQPAAPETPSVQVTASGNTERVTERGSEKALGVVSSGSEIALTSGQRVCTNTNSIGDKFTAQIADPVMGANGTVIPVGSTAVVEITSLHRSEKSGENIEIGLRVESISYGGKTYPVTSETTYAQVDRVKTNNGDAAKKVVTGAAIGAVLGQILGGKTKSTVIGAGAGAAAGAVIANRNADYDGCVPTGGRITIRLTEPLTIQLTE
ncbi:MAG TPA: glycine zipper 2TM domain-containing protein [Gemmatimonadaceae bacterium]